ncbi:MAG: preprotein translocase subunit SecY [Mycoplasmoidaceae bacterium]|nr:MAG: preprotein translocase subunit SecY [Mycoplasmoidaceae bacterium]
MSSIKSKNANVIKKILGNKTVIVSIFFTLLMVVIFHIIATIPTPGITVSEDAANGTGFSSMLNLLAGGGLNRMSIFSVGVGPYITSQIIIQLLSSDLIPPLSRMAKSGERGKKKLEVITRMIALPFCVAQAYAVVMLLLKESDGNITVFGKTDVNELSAANIITLIAIFTGGTYLAIFIGDMITKRGVGNGMTLLILSGIVSSVVSNFQIAFSVIGGNFQQATTTNAVGYILSIMLYISIFILLLFACIFVNDSVRKIPIQQTGQGLINETKDLPFLPIKLNASGVIPVIFASSLMTIPTTVAQFLSEENSGKIFINSYLQVETPVGLVIYFVLIILFSFFYSYVQINPMNLAENFQKSGKFIPGVKSGLDTEKHITRVLMRVNCLGAPFLAIVAALPYVISIVTKIPSGLALGGTGIIIIVTGSLDLWNSIVSNSTASGYSVDRIKIENKVYERESITEKSSDGYKLW